MFVYAFTFGLRSTFLKISKNSALYTTLFQYLIMQNYSLFKFVKKMFLNIEGKRTWNHCSK